MSFGDVIREARKGKGLTQAQAAAPLGLSPAWAAAVENGSAPPPDRAATHALARVLDLCPEALWALAAPERLQRLHPDLFDWATTASAANPRPPASVRALNAFRASPSRAGLRNLLDHLPGHPDVVAIRQLLGR